jgi:hypothetical protein
VLKPLSLTPLRLPKSSANERHHLPHAPSRQKGETRGESDILGINISDFIRFSSDFQGQRPVLWRAARKTFSQNRL